jgi:hypothetical protein
MSWLALSLIASIVLTIVLNVALGLFPGGADRLRDQLFRLGERPTDETDDSRRPRVRVIVPWKAMLLVSLVLTIGVNLLVHLR